MSDATENEDIYLPFEISCSPERAKRLLDNLQNLLLIYLRSAKIQFFQTEHNQIMIFFRDSDNIEKCQFSLIEKWSSEDEGVFVFNLTTKEYYHRGENFISAYSDPPVYFQGGVLEYVKILAQELSGLYIHPRKLDWLGTTIKKKPPKCFSEWLDQIQYTFLYKIYMLLDNFTIFNYNKK